MIFLFYKAISNAASIHIKIVDVIVIEEASVTVALVCVIIDI
jgi:hypothetical protein